MYSVTRKQVHIRLFRDYTKFQQNLLIKNWFPLVCDQVKNIIIHHTLSNKKILIIFKGFRNFWRGSGGELSKCATKA